MEVVLLLLALIVLDVLSLRCARDSRDGFRVFGARRGGHPERRVGLVGRAGRRGTPEAVNRLVSGCRAPPGARAEGVRTSQGARGPGARGPRGKADVARL